MILGYSVAFYIMPASYRKFKDMQVFIRDNYASVLLQEGVFNTMIEGLTVYIRARDSSGLLSGILVHDNRNPKTPVTMMAEQGQLLNTPSGAQFLLINGNRQEMDGERRQVSILHFDRYAVELSMFNSPVVNRQREAEERYLPELLFPEANMVPGLAARLKAELHNRILWSFSALFTAMLAASAFIGVQYNRRGQWRRILAISIMCGAYFAVLLSLINALSPHGWAIAGAYLFSLLSLRIAYQMCTGNIPFRRFFKRVVQ
jgi:lipopolysaccharide export system permease protein